MSVLMSEPANQPDPPVRRKRGRPPKAEKPQDAFSTFTMQLESSPLAGGPNAELTSSQVLKGGEPDSYTPVMKVFPSPHCRKRRRSGNFSLPLDAPHILRIDELLAEESRSYTTSQGRNSLHTQVLEGLSNFVNDLSQSSSLQSISNDSALEPVIVLQHDSLSRISRRRVSVSPRDKPTVRSAGTCGENLDKTVKESPQATGPPFAVQPQYGAEEDLDLFGFELVVDETGQAALIDRLGMVFLSEVSKTSIATNTTHDNTGNLQSSHVIEDSGVGFHAAGRTHLLPTMSCAFDGESKGTNVSTDYLKSASCEALFGPGNLKHDRTELDSSISHLIELQAHDYGALNHVPEYFSGGLEETTHLYSERQGSNNGFSVDTQDLVIDRSRSDTPFESADARTALRRVFRRD
ncbi:hypothetical protein METBIDRAFT_9885 [Metschnikowia bicuspidata var. bicuspidata NRRL YB-4993]|uniref:Uncharacterized protein n=1 Tax=Metschnikowia bicuspidata var. bicuspidata NRRL YB-4993 TaxID=869754 RepID=A0A1A0HIC5_9ASCO|nr:hypothetical protein METBIDRAFT_9885 [Metschnikowia bicuspidata var. bicuspidata NRRL YB-4993]OBA23637.1 hypothetical protein METBIDRAFT_9885 [Metschnikowia bicuspidata var. bicuspidata NRRL YB-4993]